MNISSTTGRAAHALKRQRRGRLAAAGVLAAALIGLLCVCWPGDGTLSALEEGTEDGTGDGNPSLSRPLFAGWIQPGHGDFGRPGRQAAPSTAPQPSWVLATEPSEQEIQAIESTLADHPDKDDELLRMVDHSRFQKRVALWNEWQNGPMNSERASLSQHLLKVLPEHYSRGELLGAQALLMAKALIKDLEPNPGLQTALLAKARSALEKQAPIIDQSELASQAVAQSFLQQQKPTPVARDAEPPEPHPALQLEAHADTARPSLLDTSGATSTR